LISVSLFIIANISKKIVSLTTPLPMGEGLEAPQGISLALGYYRLYTNFTWVGEKAFLSKITARSLGELH
jgi:hypothetical protein